MTNSGTNALIVREFMEECDQGPFRHAARQDHHLRHFEGARPPLEAIFDRLYPEHAGHLARVLVSDDRVRLRQRRAARAVQDAGHATRRHLRGHARHRRGRSRSREPGVRQARVLLRQVLADDRPRHAGAGKRSGEAPTVVSREGPLPDHRLLGQLRVLQDEPEGTGAGATGVAARPPIQSPPRQARSRGDSRANRRRRAGEG